MKMVSISLVRNEEDIIEAFVRYHCEILDHMIVYDQESTDDTLHILLRLQKEGLPITVRQNSTFEHNQSEIMTEALHDALRRFQSDWVLPLDADEFLAQKIDTTTLPTDRLHTLLSYTYIPTTEDALDHHLFERITKRRTHELKELGTILIPKRLVTPTLRIEQGNHYASDNGVRVPSVVNTNTHIAHFPYRSPRQVLQKILNGWPRHIAQFGNTTNAAFHWKKAFETLMQKNVFTYQDMCMIALLHPGKSDNNCMEEPFLLPEHILKKIQWATPQDVVLDPIMKHQAIDLARSAHEYARRKTFDEMKINYQKEHAAHKKTLRELNHIRHSKSQKITYPLRAIERWLRSLSRNNEIRTEDPSISIVIPVYNAYEETKKCLESVLASTNLVKNSLIIIDDASTDQKVISLLADYKLKYGNQIHVQRNKENIGFVQTVNIGMRMNKDRDVILLNSDTIVGPGWVESLIDTKKRKPKVASVTPLSNEASIYSVLQKESKHIDPLLLSDLVSKNSKLLRPEIPTAVGFCMLLNRNALNEIGYFDEQFGVGYGEENDWCMRARKSGWKHYLDDHCFVFHKGRSSMLPAGHILEGRTTIAAHEDVLKKRYPQYESIVETFMKNSNALVTIREQLRTSASVLQRHRKRICFVLHNDIEGKIEGGIERHVKNIVSELSSLYDCYVLFSTPNTIHVRRYWNDLQAVYVHENTDMAAVVNDLKPHIVHVHHVLGTGFDVLHKIKSKIVYSIHDSFATHTNPKPITGRETLDERNENDKQNVQDALSKARHIVAPSRFALHQFQKDFPNLEIPSSVIQHGVSSSRSRSQIKPSTPHVCFMGATHIEPKGREIIIPLTKLFLEAGMRVSFLGSEKKYWPMLEENPALKFYGSYHQNDVEKLLKTIHPSLICITSMFPETHCFVLDEAIQNGIPVFVTATGVLPERVHALGVGYVSSSLIPDEIFHQLQQYISSSEIKAHRTAAQTVHLPTKKEMAQQYQNLYESIMKPNVDTSHITQRLVKEQSRAEAKELHHA